MAHRPVNRVSHIPKPVKPTVSRRSLMATQPTHPANRPSLMDLVGQHLIRQQARNLFSRRSRVPADRSGWLVE